MMGMSAMATLAFVVVVAVFGLVLRAMRMMVMAV